MPRSTYDLENPEQYHLRRLTNPMQAYLYNHWAPIIKRYLIRLCRTRTVLDLGCGTGEHIKEANGAAFRAIGIDLSLNMLNYLKGHEPDVLSVNGSAYQLPFPDDAFDLVYSIGVLEYVKPVPVLRECSRILKKNGKLVVTTPNKYSARRLVMRCIRRKKMRSSAALYYSREQCVTLLSGAGYHVEEIIMNDGLVYLPGWVQKYIGRMVYLCFEKIMGVFPYNPVSEDMMFIAQKT